MRGDPQTCWGMGLQLQVSTKKQGCASPSWRPSLAAGASFIHYCYLYCAWYLQKAAAATHTH